jgi:hypothetical protein
MSASACPEENRAMVLGIAMAANSFELARVLSALEIKSFVWISKLQI